MTEAMATTTKQSQRRSSDPIMNIREIDLSDMPTLPYFFTHFRYARFAQQQLYIWSWPKPYFIRVCGVTLFRGSTFLYLGDNPR
jgi:hypothetical protein